MNVQKYYVNLQTNEINNYSVPGSSEYEIIATENDVTEIKELFSGLDAESKEALSYIVNYTDEVPVDEERQKYGDTLIEIYKRLLALGTEETKCEIKKLNLFTFL